MKTQHSLEGFETRPLEETITEVPDTETILKDSLLTMLQITEVARELCNIDKSNLNTLKFLADNIGKQVKLALDLDALQPKDNTNSQQLTLDFSLESADDYQSKDDLGAYL